MTRIPVSSAGSTLYFETVDAAFEHISINPIHNERYHLARSLIRDHLLDVGKRSRDDIERAWTLFTEPTICGRTILPQLRIGLEEAEAIAIDVRKIRNRHEEVLRNIRRAWGSELFDAEKNWLEILSFATLNKIHHLIKTRTFDPMVVKQVANGIVLKRVQRASSGVSNKFHYFPGDIMDAIEDLERVHWAEHALESLYPDMEQLARLGCTIGKDGRIQGDSNAIKLSRRRECQKRKREALMETRDGVDCVGQDENRPQTRSRTNGNKAAQADKNKETRQNTTSKSYRDYTSRSLNITADPKDKSTSQQVQTRSTKAKTNNNNTSRLSSTDTESTVQHDPYPWSDDESTWSDDDPISDPEYDVGEQCDADKQGTEQHSQRICHGVGNALLLHLSKECSSPYTDSQVDAVLRTILSITDKSPPGKLCRKHLRRAAKLAGLRTSKKSSVIWSSLRIFVDSFAHGELDQLRNCGATNGIFVNSARPPRWAEQHLTVEKFAPRQCVRELAAQLADEILEKEKAGAKRELDEHGSFNILVLEWLMKADDGVLWDRLMKEIDMYEHHARSMSTGSKRGWLRNCLYSLIQQAIRMDPYYYMLYVCVRADHNMWLTSYPYYIKNAREHDRTGFRHMDLHPDILLGRQASTINGWATSDIQGSISLTNEDHGNCTIILRGMHRWMKDWWPCVKARWQGQLGRAPPKGPLLNLTPNIFTPADEARFGSFKGVPCKRGEARITYSAIGHGSTTSPNKLRRTVLPWFIGICADHETLDNPTAGTWSQLRAAHCDFVAAPTSPSGQQDMFGKVVSPFAAVMPLRTSRAKLPLALVGQTRFTTGQVQRELRILFGEDREKAGKYIEDVHNELIAAIRHSLDELREVEMDRYKGWQSYFRWQEESGVPNDVPEAADPDDVCDLDPDLERELRIR